MRKILALECEIEEYIEIFSHEDITSGKAGKFLGSEHLCGGSLLNELKTAVLLRCPDAPGHFFIGGVLDHGSVTGVGKTIAEASARVAGEIAESIALHQGPAASGASGKAKTGIWHNVPAAACRDCVSGQWCRTGEPVAIPRALVQHGDGAVTGISNGCAAGIGRQRAQMHAIAELIERDAVMMWWHGGQPGIGLILDPASEENYRKDTGAQRAFQLYDVTGDSALPVVAAVSFDQHGRNFAGGAAAGLSLTSAARAALREMHQMETGLRIINDRLEVFGIKCLNDVDQQNLARATKVKHSAFSSLAAYSSRDFEFEHLQEKPEDFSEVINSVLDDLCVIDYRTQGGLSVVKVLSGYLQPPDTNIASQRLTEHKSLTTRTLADVTGCDFY